MNGIPKPWSYGRGLISKGRKFVLNWVFECNHWHAYVWWCGMDTMRKITLIEPR